MNITIFYVTFPNNEIALKFSEKLLLNKIIACYNISNIQSGYWWKEQIQNEKEFVAIYKTTQQNTLNLEKYINVHHPYEVPCIMRWEVEVNVAYGEWIEAMVQ